jgi:hypothetical protein
MPLFHPTRPVRCATRKARFGVRNGRSFGEPTKLEIRPDLERDEIASWRRIAS